MSTPLTRREFLSVSAAGALTPIGSLAAPRRLLGITVMPEFIQNEGIDGVLRNLKRTGANAVTTSPYVMELADERNGSREPPDDAGAGAVRWLDRPLWGRRELYVRTAPSFVPAEEDRARPITSNSRRIHGGATQFALKL